MKWKFLNSVHQISELVSQSFLKPILIFKHSTRCSISSSALNRLERNWNNTKDIDCYFIDLIKYREVSNKVAEIFEIQHQSPQVLIIQDGKCTYHASHFEIEFDAIIEQLNA